MDVSWAFRRFGVVAVPFASLPSSRQALGHHLVVINSCLKNFISKKKKK